MFVPMFNNVSSLPGKTNGSHIGYHNKCVSPPTAPSWRRSSCLQAFWLGTLSCQTDICCEVTWYLFVPVTIFHNLRERRVMAKNDEPCIFMARDAPFYEMILVLYYLFFINILSGVRLDRLCGLLVRVPSYRSRSPGSIPGVTRFSEN
jgi:hypothetical protein